MSNRTIRIATRQSPLALKQANHVRELLIKQWPNRHFELVPMISSGDKFLKDKLLTVGGKGLFVKELEEALLDKRACIAVHSTKDMPADCPPGLFLAVICKRDDPFDAFISINYPNLDALPLKAIVGTASLRRQSQLLAYRPDLHILPLRGNINTRLTKLKTEQFDAIILATAGLMRMGFTSQITEILSESVMLPSCGQGALCIECRVDDLEIQEMISFLDDPLSSVCVRTERLVNAQLGGNCHIPLAVFCKPVGDQSLLLTAKIGTIDGTRFIEHCQSGTINQADELAHHCTKSLIEKGAAELLQTLLP
ncbi:MAG: hydroxymethylbilane synthase [Legionella sp.]|nr:hydroxymethylbilane synthase [Legionella sp.]